MSYAQAVELLDRVRNGDNSISERDITYALYLTGDIEWTNERYKSPILPE